MFNKTSRSEKQDSETKQTKPASETAESSEEHAAAMQNPDMPEGMEATVDSGESVRETEDWQGKYQLLQDQFTRLAADFDNYRKRMREEQESLVRYGAQKSVLELLPVLDNLERATASLSENSDPKVLYKSFSVLHKQLMDALDSLGIKKIQAIGQPFDPQYHEAVNRMPSAEFPENSIAYEAQSGYQLHDRVIRPAMVVVSTGSPDAPAAPDSQAEGSEAAVAENQSNPFLR
jgi:molecular chaperone GrpE